MIRLLGTFIFTVFIVYYEIISIPNLISLFMFIFYIINLCIFFFFFCFLFFFLFYFIDIYRVMLSDKKYGLSVNIMATRVMPSLIPQTVNPSLNLEQFTILLEVNFKIIIIITLMYLVAYDVIKFIIMRIYIYIISS